MRYVTRPTSRRHLPRLAIAAAGFVALGIGWRLTSAEPASAGPTAMEVVPIDYVPEDSGVGLDAPIDPLSAADAPLTVAPAGPSAPLDFLRVTSSFGMRRHPILGFSRMHQGVDFAAREGAPVLASADGVVTQAGVEGGYGNLIRIRHAGGWGTGYAHLSGYAPGIATGVAVTRGEVIGFVGHTGLATGPHLHFEVSLAGVKLDPMTTPFGGAPTTDPHAGAYARLRPAITVDLPPA
ncbi:MAG TPA: M23 family metallopeptidase [Caulobacteraceae bacterium]|nr:M23 family metallopeptidase [Caulobacteraceae bacterium]